MGTGCVGASLVGLIGVTKCLRVTSCCVVKERLLRVIYCCYNHDSIK